MLYEIISKILKISDEKGVDVTVAREMLKTDEPDKIAEINDAYKVLHKYYEEIAAFNRESKPEHIEELCSYVNTEDMEALEAFLKAHKDFFELSFKNAQKNNK